MVIYPDRPETIVNEHAEPTTFACPFIFNELVAMLDENGQDTGQRARFVGLEIDTGYQFTGKANVSIVNGPCQMIPLKYLAQVKH